MATTTAKTKKDVDEMSKADRLYDSLSYSYGKKGERIEKEYNKAYSQADRQALSRGMQRSSWNGQTLAGINAQKINALNDNESNLIADYENRLFDIENKEQEQANWEKQFSENQRQYNENMAYSRERAAVSDQQWADQFKYQQTRDTVADAQWQKQYDEQRRQFDANMAYQRERANVSDAQWQKTYEENLREFNAQFAENQRQYNENLAYQKERAAASDQQWQREYEANRADTAWSQAFQTQQYADSRADTAWSQALTERQYADNRADTAWQQAFSEKQWQAQLDQWNKEFNYTQMSDEQKINYNYVTYALQNGNDVSDEMLRKAGISRADFNAMKTQATTVSNGGGNPGSTSHDDYVDQSGNIYTWDANSGKYVLKPKSGVNDSSYNSDLFGLGNNTTTPSSTTSNSSLMHEASHTASKLADLLKKNK